MGKSTARTLKYATLLASALLAARPARGGDLSPSVPHWNPSFPVFGGGKFVNIFDEDHALTNASAHIGWALAFPFAGEAIGGRKGKWIAGVSWMALTLLQESLFHAPPNPGPGYPAEVRADLITRLVPTMLVLGWDLWRGDRGSSRAIDPRGARPPLRVEGDAPDAKPIPVVRQPLWMCPDAPPPVVRTAAASTSSHSPRPGEETPRERGSESR